MSEKTVFIFGTSAEFLKIMPIVRSVGAEKVLLLYTGQQTIAELSSLAEEIELVPLHSRPWDVAFSYYRLICWLVLTPLRLARLLRVRRRTGLPRETMIVHGDTITTLLGALVAKSQGYFLGHVEAGLRSGSLLHPFPEEIVRKIVSRLADIHFAPGEKPARALSAHSGRVIDTVVNTSTELLSTVEEVPPQFFNLSEPFVLISLHRFELFRTRVQLGETVRQVCEIAQSFPIVLILDTISAGGFERPGLLTQLLRSNVMILPKLPHGEFLYLLKRCSFLITDSGGQQEEAFVLGVPCIVHRKRTERNEGIGWNARLSGWDPGSLVRFSRNYESFRKEAYVRVGTAPSKIIARALAESSLAS